MIDHKPVEILLVEDNEDDIIIIQEALAEAKLLNLITVVRDGEQALAYVRRQNGFERAETPGLVLLDINMPRKNGFEVLQEMKGDPALRHIPIVMMTVSQRDEDVAESFAKGACSYIRKPVDFESLKQVIRSFEIYWTMVSRIPERRG
jgi:CheY-like chemotaxis protein